MLLKLLVALIPQTADDHDAPAITLTHRSTACMWHGNLWKSLQIAAFLPRTLQCYWLFCSTYMYYLYCIVCDYAAPFIERFSREKEEERLSERMVERIGGSACPLHRLSHSLSNARSRGQADQKIEEGTK